VPGFAAWFLSNFSVAFATKPLQSHHTQKFLAHLLQRPSARARLRGLVSSQILVSLSRQRKKRATIRVLAMHSQLSVLKLLNYQITRLPNPFTVFDCLAHDSSSVIRLMPLLFA
jgi:hypothetical protein